MLKNFLPHIVAVLIIVGLIFYGNSTITKIKYDYDKQAKEMQDISETKMKRFEESRTVEREQLEENIKNLQHELEVNRVAYETQLTALQTKKKKEISVLIEKEPLELADDVGAATGFRVLTPVK
jgi:hypothetical protein